MNYNTMTAQQCADWLAERDGWEYRERTGVWRREIPERREYEYRDDHPFALTLDGAAAALREPWRWVEIEWWSLETVAAVFVRTPHDLKRMTKASDELTARYRAAVAARMEDDK